MKIESRILRQIETELSYAELKHPKQKLPLDRAIKISFQKLNSISICNLSGQCHCPIGLRPMCSAFSTIAVLIRGLCSEEDKTFNQRTSLMLELLLECLDKTK